MLTLDEKKIRKGKPIGLPYQGSKKKISKKIVEIINEMVQKKVLYLAVFPLFLFTYAPITIIALFKPVEWTPIAHHSTRELLKSTK